MELWKQTGAMFDSPVTPENLAVFNILGRVSGSDAETLAHNAYNRAGPVFRTLEGRSLANRRQIGLPTIGTDFLRFAPGQAVRNNLSEANEWCDYSLIRCTDTEIGATSNDRDVVWGNYENTASKGSVLYSQTSQSWRVFTYDAGGTVRTATVSVPDTIAKWRWIYTHVKSTGSGNFELAIINLTGDSTTNAPTPTTFTGRSLGIHKDAVGYPFAQYTKHADASLRAHFSGVAHNEAQRAQMLAALRKVAAARSVTELG